MSYSSVTTGGENSLDFRIFYKNEADKVISPWHDIPLKAGTGNLYNAVIEIPRWTNAKMEIATDEVGNPIKQDTKKGKLRYVKSPFPYQGYIWNYGAIPQTWENPNHVDEIFGTKGDNDPIDVCEIGQRIAKRGEVIQVKILGLLAMIDEGETDWKILAINVTDPLADKLNDIADIEKHMPGLLKATHEWFSVYKINDGKPLNTFGFDGKPQSADYAIKVIEDTHEHWKKWSKDVSSLAGPTNELEMQKVFSEAQNSNTTPGATPEDVDKWWFGHVGQYKH